MSGKQVAALQSLALTVVSLLVTLGLVGEDVSNGVVAVVAAAFAALGAFIISSPRDK